MITRIRSARIVTQNTRSGRYSGFTICTFIRSEVEFSDEVERAFRNETPFNFCRFGRKSRISRDTRLCMRKRRRGSRSRIHAYVRTFTRVEGEVPVLDDVALTSTSFYDLRAMRLRPYALRLRCTYIYGYILVTSSGRVGCAVETST